MSDNEIQQDDEAIEAAAAVVATAAHAGQTRKRGEKYITHPHAVASVFTDPVLRQIAWLHDVVEDTKITLEDLRGLCFSARVVMAVDALTKREDESYDDRIKRCCMNPDAVRVKIADIAHNIPTAEPHAVAKYMRALPRLFAALTGETT